MSSGTQMERHLNTILLSVAVAVLGWIGLSTQATAVKVAAIETKIDSMVLMSTDHEARIRELERRTGTSTGR